MIIDILCIALFLLFALWGWKKGFMRSVFSFFSFFIAIILAFFLEPTISTTFENTAVADKIETTVYEYIVEKEAKEIQETDDQFSGTITEETAEKLADIRESAAKETTRTIIRVFSILLVVIITKLLIFAISILLKTASKLPIIHHFDCVLGGVFGLLTAYLIIQLVFLMLGVCETADFAAKVIASLDTSVVGKYFYENNMILHTFLNLE